MRVMTHQSSLPREAVDAPSPGNVQDQTGWTLSNLVGRKVSFPMAGGLNKMISKVPSNPKHSFLDNIRFCTPMNTAEITEQMFGNVFQRIF